MKKSEADKIAQKIANDWKLFWMSQTQNSKQDYDNYFRRALAVDANMRAHLESLISAALLEASNATKESQSVECVHSWKLEANQYVCMKCNLLNSIAEYRGKEKVAEFEEAYEDFRHKHINASFMPKEMAKAMFLAGQASREIRLPDERQLQKHSGMWAIAKQRDSAIEDFEMGAYWMLENIFKFNELKKTPSEIERGKD